MCKNYDPSGDMEELTFTRKIFYTVWNSLVRGWYHERKRNLISQECFGEWMEKSLENFDTIFGKLDEGKFFSISKAEVKKAADDSIDFFYKNAEVCGFYRVVSDQMNWCTNNVGTCIYQDDIVNRLTQNATPIMTKGLDLFELIASEEDNCLNDTETLDMVDRIMTDIVSLCSSFFGFNDKWNQSKALGEWNLEKLNQDLNKAIDAYDEKHPYEVEKTPSWTQDSWTNGYGMNMLDMKMF